MAETKGKFDFAIDRGGTFTDVFARLPDGRERVLKLLSRDPQNYKDAPTEGIRRVLEEVRWRRCILLVVLLILYFLNHCLVVKVLNILQLWTRLGKFYVNMQRLPKMLTILEPFHILLPPFIVILASAHFGGIVCHILILELYYSLQKLTQIECEQILNRI